MKTMAFPHKVKTRKELLQLILGAVRSINNAVALRKFISSLVTRVRKCIKTDVEQFEQLA